MTTAIQSGWTDERVERSKAMWLDGSSASEIARHIGGISRNAVLGKMLRLGLKRSEGALGVKRYRAAQNVGRKGAAALAKARAAVPVEEKPRRFIHASPTISPMRLQPMPPAPAGKMFDATAAKVWTERAFGECAYPVGGDRAETLSCCLKTLTGATYCVGHAAIMFTPGTSARDLIRSVRRAA